MKDCWPSFPHAYPDWEVILNSHEEFHSIQGQESTIAQRQREFKKITNKFSAIVSFFATIRQLECDLILITNTQMADNAHRSGFEGFFVMVGNCINEDSGLGHVSVTPGAEN